MIYVLETDDNGQFKAWATPDKAGFREEAVNKLMGDRDEDDPFYEFIHRTHYSDIMEDLNHMNNQEDADVDISIIALHSEYSYCFPYEGGIHFQSYKDREEAVEAEYTYWFRCYRKSGLRSLIITEDENVAAFNTRNNVSSDETYHYILNSLGIDRDILKHIEDAQKEEEKK